MLPTSFNLRHIVELREQLEVERMRLAACGTAALGYFNGCADQYKSASLADVLRLREQLDQQIVANAALTGENSELFCKLSAAQKDAERIAWIARQDFDSIYFEIFQDQPNEGLYGVSIGAGWSVGETFREAIDAAIAKEKAE